MKIAIVGAGGIGGHLGVKLASAGNEVSVVARGAHLAAIRDRGLTLRSGGTETNARFVAASANGADLPPADLVIIATKGQDLEGAAEAAAPLVKGDAAVWPIQNGVEATGILAERFGAERVLIGIARLSAFIAGPGVIEHATPFASYIMGEADGCQQSARVQVFNAMFAEAGIEMLESTDVRVDLWKKFAMLVPFSATTAGARCDGHTVARTPELAALYRTLAEEVVALARAENIDVPADFPNQAVTFLDKFEPGVRASMAHDLEAGKPIEIDWLSGAVPRLGARHGLKAPANAAVAALLAPFRDGKPKPS